MCVAVLSACSSNIDSPRLSDIPSTIDKRIESTEKKSVKQELLNAKQHNKNRQQHLEETE